jgi:hypothetical protein
MPFNRIKGINGSSNIDMRNLCLVFKRDVDLSSEVSETSINYNNKFTNMKFSSFYRSPLSLVDYVGKTGSNIKYNEVLNIQENSNIPLNGLISFDNFKNTKQYDILECDFNKTTDNECKNINFFNDIKASVGTKIQKLNNSVDIIKYKILPGTEIISDNINTGAIDINFQDNIFTNLIMIDIYTDRLITGDHGDAVSGNGPNGYNGGSGSNGNNGGPAILFKNITNSQLKAYVYENGNKISGGFGSSGGNGGNAGKPDYNVLKVDEVTKIDEVTAVHFRRYNLSADFKTFGTKNYIKNGMYVGKEGADNSAGQWYFVIFINSYKPTFFQYLRSTIAYKTRSNAATIIDAFFESKERIGVGDQFLDDWRFLYISSRATTGGVTTSLNDWGTGLTGDREGYIYSIDLYIYYHTNSTAIPDNSTQETAYVATRNRVEPVKAYRQIGLAATEARQGTFATPRINNALTIFTAIKGSNGSDAPANAIDNLLKAAGNPGIGGNPGGNGREILTTPLTIFNDLIRI